MAKVIKQPGKESEITLDWAVMKAQESYNLLFVYFDEVVKPHTTKERIAISENGKQLVNMLVRSLKMATLLADEDTVLKSIFNEHEVQVVEHEPNGKILDFEEYRLEHSNDKMTDESVS